MSFLLFSIFSALCTWSSFAAWDAYKHSFNGLSSLIAALWSVLAVGCMYMAISCWQGL
jgi:hypothetical protein